MVQIIFAKFNMIVSNQYTKHLDMVRLSKIVSFNRIISNFILPGSLNYKHREVQIRLNKFISPEPNFIVLIRLCFIQTRLFVFLDKGVYEQQIVKAKFFVIAC